MTMPWQPSPRARGPLGVAELDVVAPHRARALWLSETLGRPPLD